MSPRVINLGFASVLPLLALATSSCGDGTAPPKPTRLVFVTEPPATAETMVPLTTQPVLQTVDANGQAAGSSTTITVDVVGTNGVVAAGGTATTNSTGLATFSGLTLGAVNGAVGESVLQFSAPGLATISKTIDLHCAILPLTTSQTVNRAVTQGDCAFSNGTHHNMFALTTADPVTAVTLSEVSALPGGIQFRGPNEPLYFWGYSVGPFQPDNRVTYKTLLPPGRTLVAVSLLQNALGGYTLTTTPASTDLTCENTPTSAASPITSAQQLIDGDCVENSFLEDVVGIGLPSNASVTATMTSSAFDPQIKLLDGFTFEVITSSTTQGSTSLTFTNSNPPHPYYLLMTSSVAGASGAYNFTLNITYPNPSERAGIRAPSVITPLPPSLRRRQCCRVSAETGISDGD